ncbi:uncharacterized protein LOC126778347 [Nymphalis io]|uniref:uncharacterized protein LOC126778347 n=1 Tax=Inachis io TaxID=171585 RepID=UPI002167FEF1|nr:uncharacterized protein LOC126778347 [Nymphalis io]
MNTFTVFNLYLVIYITNECGSFESGEDSGPRQFQYISMDFVHRGSFNNTDCLRELLNCWEVVKPDIICNRGVVFESVCGIMKRECSEKRGLINQLDGPLFESFCKSDGYDQRTRRAGARTRHTAVLYTSPSLG